MKPSDEQWTRWLDGDLPPDEAEALEASVGEASNLEEDRAFFSRFSEDLKQTFPSERMPPFADFFNSHIQKQIRDVKEAEWAAKNERRSWWPDWFRLSWAVPLVGAAVVVLTLMQIGVIGGRSGSQIVYAYTPDEGVTALTDFNEDANAVVVRLEGVERLPEGFDLLLADAAEDAPGPFVVDAADPVVIDGGAFVFVGPQIQFTAQAPVY